MTDLDAAAIDLCQLYQRENIAGFFIRTTEDNNLRVIGLQLPPEVVARMLHSAADLYLANAPELVRN